MIEDTKKTRPSETQHNQYTYELTEAEAAFIGPEEASTDGVLELREGGTCP